MDQVVVTSDGRLRGPCPHPLMCVAPLQVCRGVPERGVTIRRVISMEPFSIVEISEDVAVSSHQLVSHQSLGLVPSILAPVPSQSVQEARDLLHWHPF
ncbi:hypothetical protein ARMSODRAFT_514938 [Armillaria solidipes]|uniref:Uncharacterized protein n=1 Tax=Armillaria solidipes TaxID=1076256 RepID=A0A2H3BHE4_9AGAR|nr:hypothetical protein ARMSODRAFT_514938 [Armillaria solidipes]